MQRSVALLERSSKATSQKVVIGPKARLKEITRGVRAMSRAKPAVLLIFVALILMPAFLYAQKVALPPVNLGGTSFLDGVAGPGLMSQERIQYYHATKFMNSKGDQLPGNNSVDSWLAMNQAAYITKFKILGGYYGCEALLPVVKLDVDTDLGTGGDKTGLGDLILSPFELQWVDQKVLGIPYFHRLNLSFVVPTGQYNEHSTVNIGKNVYSFNPYYAFTLFITPKLETSWRFHYLWNSKNNDPPLVFKASSVQPGQAFHLNYAVSYEILSGLRVGISGYYLQQTTSNKVDGKDIPNSKERVFAVGPGIMYSKDNFFLTLTANFETGVENRPEGQRYTFCIKKVF